MLPLEKLAAQIMGWGVVVLLSALFCFLLGSSFFAYMFAGLTVVLLAFLYERILMFKFVYENTRGVQNTKESDGSN